MDGTVTIHRVAADQVDASRERLDVRMGANRCYMSETGAIEITLESSERFTSVESFAHEFGTSPKDK